MIAARKLLSVYVFLKLCKTGSVSSVILLDGLGACQSDERLFVWEKV